MRAPVPVSPSSSDSSPESHPRTIRAQLLQTRRLGRRFPPLVRVTKEVPLPAELQDAPESAWTMLCEDALLAFEVRVGSVVCFFFVFYLF